MSGPIVFVGRLIPNLKVVPCNLKFVLWKMGADDHHDIMPYAGPESRTTGMRPRRQPIREIAMRVGLPFAPFDRKATRLSRLRTRASGGRLKRGTAPSRETRKAPRVK